jgi:hypothetical protein
LEINQNKYVFQYNIDDKKTTAIQLMINPQVSIRSKEAVSKEMLLTELKNINETNK